MADDNNTDESKKTLVAFVVGLLIGGMLVWAFTGPSDETKNTDDDKDKIEETASTTKVSGEVEGAISKDKGPQLAVGDANIVIKDQAAAATVKIDSATYPIEEGWIGVRDLDGDKQGYILGVVRFSKSHGLVPQEIVLQRPTVAGKEYAVVIFKENGDFDWEGGDEQLPEVFATFKAE